MSGHSKWNNIKHKKEKTDAQKAKIFTKIGKEITIAVKEAGFTYVTLDLEGFRSGSMNSVLTK